MLTSEVGQEKTKSVPDGVSIIDGFSERKVRGHVEVYMEALIGRIEREEACPTLVFPLNGAIFV